MTSIRIGTFVNVIGMVIPAMLMIVTVPAFLRTIGEARYGVLGLIYLLIGYSSFLEVGMGRAVARQIAKSTSDSPIVRSEIFWTAFTFNFVVGIVAAIAFSNGFIWILDLSGVTDSSLQQELRDAAPFMACIIPVTLLSSVLNGSLEGASKFIQYNIFGVLTQLFVQVAPLVSAMLVDPKLSTLVISVLFVRTILNLIQLAYCIYSVLQTSKIVHSWSRAKELMQFGSWIGLSSVLAPILETTEKFLVGWLIGPAAVGFYLIAYQFAGKFRILPAAFARALFPRLSVVSSDTRLAVDSVRAVAGLTAPLVCFALVLSPWFIGIWLGPTAPHYIVDLVAIFLFGFWLNGVGMVAAVAVTAKGRPEKLVLIYAMEIVPFLAGLLLLMNFFGIIGAALAWTLRALADAVLLSCFAGVRTEDFLRISVTALPVCCAVLVVCTVLPARVTQIEFILFGLALILVSVVLCRKNITRLLPV